MSQLTNLRKRSRRALLLAGLACSLLTLATPPISGAALPPNGNGNYTQILCADPATNEGAGVTGMPEGLSNPASTILWQVSGANADCKTGPMISSRGVPMLVAMGGDYGQGTWSALLYQAPSDAKINAGRIYRAERAEGPDEGFMGINQQGGEYQSLYSEPSNCCDVGDWYAGNVAKRGTFATPFAAENLVNLTISPDSSHWDVNATCDPNGNNNSSCTLTAGQWEYRIFGGEISLHTSRDPQANNISGPLVTDSPLRSTESITFSATDEGPGLAYVKVLVDGTVAQSQIIDTNGGHCVPVPGKDAYTWAYQIPCSTSVGGRTYSLNTALLPNGPHHIQVILEDAAGNQSEVLNRTVTIENSSLGSLGASPGPGGGLPLPIGSPGLLLAGTPNGTNATTTAILRLGVSSPISRPFSRRSLSLPGRLVSSTGQPIGAATLDVLEKITGTTSTRVIGHVRTAANGTFIAKVSAGPSRSIDVAYRASSGETGNASEAKVQESVQAGVRLNVTPTRTGAQGTVVLSGKVEGQIPRQGKIIVDLLVHYRGRWVPFRTPRTDGRGGFHARYQFQGGKGRYPFRAEVPSGQAGFPFASGDSHVIDVRTR